MGDDATMRAAGRTHILFDFFGTLVDYSPSRTEQGYEQSHALLRTMGADVSYGGFLAAWSATSANFDRRADADDHEFSMTEAGTEFLADLLGRAPTDGEVKAFVDRYVGEWNKGVLYRHEVIDCVAELAEVYRLAVVTNTHQPDLVPNHLAAMGLRDRFDAVITSVEVGWRKPHPKIFRAVLDAVGIEAQAAVFVGDSYQPDFAGPERAGITAFLIDPLHRTPVPEPRRLGSILDLPGRLRAGVA
jgi:putative hydrolase of the HAD superfamily